MDQQRRWSPENEAALRRLWATGLSANAIAKQLGPNFTRNAIIGKAVRLGLWEAKKGRSAVRAASSSLAPVSTEKKMSPSEAATTKEIGKKRSKKNSAAARIARRKEEREARKASAAAIAQKRAAARDAARAEASRLAAAKRRNAEARMKLNQKLISVAADRIELGDSAAKVAPFETLRKRWFAAVMYVHRFGYLDGSAEDVLSARRLIGEIEAEWDRLIGVPRGHPDYFEWPSTDPRAGEGKIDSGGWEATGMLGYLGYKVGKTSDLTKDQRQFLLKCAFSTYLPPINSTEYMRGWGAPESPQRLQKMAESLASFIRLRKQRRDTNFHEAIFAWEQDLQYLYIRYYVGKFGFAWPSI